MIFENTAVSNFEGAIRGMRNPMDSWNKSDSTNHEGKFVIGSADLSLAQNLIRAGSEHRKFLRQIFVCVDITAPLYFWSEFDTYKVATVANSCSTMHKLHAYPIVEDMFAFDESYLDEDDKAFIRHGVHYLESKRRKFKQLLESKDPSAIYEFRKLKQALYSSFKQKRTVTLNYETLLNMCSKGQRRNHRLFEWSNDFMNWARSLPLAKELIFIDEIEKEIA